MSPPAQGLVSLADDQALGEGVSELWGAGPARVDLRAQWLPSFYCFSPCGSFISLRLSVLMCLLFLCHSEMFFQKDPKTPSHRGRAAISLPNDPPGAGVTWARAAPAFHAGDGDMKGSGEST